MSTYTEIASLNAPSSNVFAFTGLTLSSYTLVQVVMTGITVTTDGTDIKITLYVATVEIVTTYVWGTHQDRSTGIGNSDNSTSTSSALQISNDVDWDVGNASTESFGGIAIIDVPTSTALHKKVCGENVLTYPGGSVIGGGSIGLLPNTGAVDGIKVSGTSNLTAGKVRLLGVA